MSKSSVPNKKSLRITFIVVNIIIGLPWYIILVIGLFYTTLLFGIGLLLIIAYLLIWLEINLFIINPGSTRSEKFLYVLKGFCIGFISGFSIFAFPRESLNQIVDQVLDLFQS